MIKFFNQDKLKRAKKSLNPEATENEVLEAYKKLGGKFEEFEETGIPESSTIPPKEKPKRKSKS